MLPKKISKQYQNQFFKIELIDLVNPEHELVIFANKFNWAKIDETCSAYFCNDNGRVGHSSRLVIGLAKAKCGLAKNKLKGIAAIQSMHCSQLLHIT